MIVERPDRRVMAVEVKLGRTATDEDVRHLRCLQEGLGADLVDAIVVTTGEIDAPTASAWCRPRYSALDCVTLGLQTRCRRPEVAEIARPSAG